MMNKAEIPAPKRLLRDEALDWFERNDGPRWSVSVSTARKGWSVKWIGIITSARS